MLNAWEHVMLTPTAWMRIAEYAWIIRFSVGQRHAVPCCFDIRACKPKLISCMNEYEQ